MLGMLVADSGVAAEGLLHHQAAQGVADEDDGPFGRFGALSISC